MLNAFTDPQPSLWVALAVALVLGILLVKARLSYRAIPILSKAGGAAADCMVVIPARNEEASIARAVRSFPHDTVLVVDDHSEDETADAARKAGAGVLAAPNLVRGAYGKSNACWAAARVLTSKWLLFADADTWFDPGFLEIAVSHAEAAGLVFLSVYPRAEWKGIAGRILGPLAEALYFCGIGWGDRTAMFCGQCILVRREPYEFVGGHLAVINSVMEEVHLATLAERHRMKFAVVRSALAHGSLVNNGIWRGYKRLTLRLLISPATGVSTVFTAIVMLAWVAAIGWLLLDRSWLPAGIMALLPCALLASWYRGLGALLAPLGMIAMAPVVWNALLAAFTGRRVIWKGRTI